MARVHVVCAVLALVAGAALADRVQVNLDSNTMSVACRRAVNRVPDSRT